MKILFIILLTINIYANKTENQIILKIEKENIKIKNKKEENYKKILKLKKENFKLTKKLDENYLILKKLYNK